MINRVTSSVMTHNHARKADNRSDSFRNNSRSFSDWRYWVPRRIHANIFRAWRHEHDQAIFALNALLTNRKEEKDQNAGAVVSNGLLEFQETIPKERGSLLKRSWWRTRNGLLELCNLIKTSPETRLERRTTPAAAAAVCVVIDISKNRIEVCKRGPRADLTFR